MIRLALLYFPSEKRSYVRPINTIEDLPEPRSVTDFEEHKLYSVKWDVLKREDSDTVEKAFHAKILLLASKCYIGVELPAALKLVMVRRFIS